MTTKRWDGEMNRLDGGDAGASQAAADNAGASRAARRRDGAGDDSASGAAEAVLAVLGAHASCRAYLPEEIPEEVIERIVQAAQRAATSSNLQMWSAVVVRDAQRRERLARLCGDQRHIREAPVFIAWCADRGRLDRAAELGGYHQNTEYLESFLVAAVDTAIAMQNAVVAAEALGYGTCYIGGLRNDTASVVDLLELPPRGFPIAGMTIGVPKRAGTVRPRLDLPAVLHWERYVPEQASMLLSYDGAMRETGIYRERQVAGIRADGTPAPALPEEEYGWIEHSARRVSTPSRKGLSEVVRAQGFHLR
jgi:nitroreductase